MDLKDIKVGEQYISYNEMDFSWGPCIVQITRVEVEYPADEPFAFGIIVDAENKEWLPENLNLNRPDEGHYEELAFLPYELKEP